MFLHLDQQAELALRRERAEGRARAWASTRRARGGDDEVVVTLGGLLHEAGAVLADAEVAGHLDGTDPRATVLVEALVTELVALAPPDAGVAGLAPRDGEAPVVAVRTLATIAQRTVGRRIVVPTRRAGVVRGLLRQLGRPAGAVEAPAPRRDTGTPVRPRTDRSDPTAA